MILEEKGKHEEKITSERKQAKDPGKKMWMINKLKGKEEIENSESEMYNIDGVPLKQEEAVDLIIQYWKEIYQKWNNDMKLVWILKEKNSYIKHSMEMGENVMATMLREGCVREQSIPVELQEYFDVLSAHMRIENENKIKLQYNVQNMETKFHCDLWEHMDVRKVKIEMLDTKRYMEKIKWSQMEVQKKLLSVKSGKQPGTDMIWG